jgi:hypothetical protein
MKVQYIHGGKTMVKPFEQVICTSKMKYWKKKQVLLGVGTNERRRVNGEDESDGQCTLHTCMKIGTMMEGLNLIKVLYIL